MELFLQIFILSIVEGLTEFLPVSSTAHLIVTGELLDFDYVPNKMFEIVVQLGAILPVLVVYRSRFLKVISGVFADKESQSFCFSLIISFLPIAIIGLLFHDFIKNYLFSAEVVGLSMIIGGIVFLYADKIPAKNLAINKLNFKKSLLIGMTQSLAVIPGMSRSGASIIGGLLAGLKKEEAVEYSFFMALPAVFAATFYDLYKNWQEINSGHIFVMLAGFVMSFVASYIVVKALITFVSRFGFKHFAYYRILFGIIVLVMFMS